MTKKQIQTGLPAPDFARSTGMPKEARHTFHRTDVPDSGQTRKPTRDTVKAAERQGGRTGNKDRGRKE